MFGKENKKSNSKLKVTLLIVVIVAIGGGVYWWKSNQQKPISNTNVVINLNDDYSSEELGEEFAEDEAGIIEGSLNYPSEEIPEDLKVCAGNIVTKEMFCTSEHLEDEKYTYGLGYQLSVPPGNYYIAASTNQMANYVAYYSEFVTCGQEYSCSSHKPILVTVLAGDKVIEIDPQDWYNL